MENENSKTNESNKPVHEVRIASIKAAIWANAVPSGIRRSVTFTRLFKDGDTWRSSSNFGRNDMLILSKVADAAFEWIVANQKKEAAE